MDRELEVYLSTVEKYLKRMTITERVDVINELKSTIEELQIKNSLSNKEIMERLGSPKELAGGYLSDKISLNNKFDFKKFLMVFSFYSLTSLSGMFVIPCGTVLAGGLMVCGFIAPAGGLIKLIGFLLGYDMPFLIMQIGNFVLHPLLAFPFSVVFGGLLFFLGKKLWKAVVIYIRNVSVAKKKAGL